MVSYLNILFIFYHLENTIFHNCSKAFCKNFVTSCMHSFGSWMSEWMNSCIEFVIMYLNFLMNIWIKHFLKSLHSQSIFHSITQFFSPHALHLFTLPASILKFLIYIHKTVIPSNFAIFFLFYFIITFRYKPMHPFTYTYTLPYTSWKWKLTFQSP